MQTCRTRGRRLSPVHEEEALGSVDVIQSEPAVNILE